MPVTRKQQPHEQELRRRGLRRPPWEVDPTAKPPGELLGESQPLEELAEQRRPGAGRGPRPEQR